ncbi:acid--ammonia (or amine) ligase-like protein [Alcanivorax sp. 521-1]|uniref:Acid--ammonia (Or amine) ligase-like protein n=1 Tax=Alloalcanivorax profundimaris TaxID=2735259 RepID=A0ABS0AS32_9GAMM|nr:cobyrinate a,c-diamide synthase [Alloalcanivorax profundimaris]MBF5056954.1 acid--ammonia (or amine) ligase-like protein [Alloalcanivorax profundimaris]
MTANESFAGTVPAALISAPGSGQGKSLVTAALARLHRNAGRRVRVFKFGPDYLDPMVLERASGAPVYQLQPWMTGEAECRWRLAEAATQADLILVEGAMGLFDGTPSSADLAVLAGIPAIPVIDAWGMAQTFGAVALGLARYRDDLTVGEVIANRVASPRHGDLLAKGLPADLTLLGAVPRHEAMTLPERHLGLVQAGELDDLDQRLDQAAAVLAEAGLDRLPAPVAFNAPRPTPPPRLLDGKRIGVARDAAFAFLYPANLDLLRDLGAELRFFSPLADTTLPAVDALWLPGGYPELHGATLAANTALREAIRAHHEAGKPILAECGGLMSCLETLVDGDGEHHQGFGLLPGTARLTRKLQGLGMHALRLGDQELRGHTFHHAALENAAAAQLFSEKQSGTGGEPVFVKNGLVASFFHGYFPSSPTLVAAILEGRFPPPR